MPLSSSLWLFWNYFEN